MIPSWSILLPRVGKSQRKREKNSGEVTMRNVGMAWVRTAALATALAALGGGTGFAADAAGVIGTYADIAHAGYEDSLITARGARRRGRCADREAERGDADRRPGRLARRACALSADRGLPLRQRHRR